MTEDFFHIPPQFDRRGETVPAAGPVKTAKRHWIMPTAAKVAKMRRDREAENARIKRAAAKDLKAAVPDHLLDAAVQLQKKVK